MPLLFAPNPWQIRIGGLIIGSAVVLQIIAGILLLKKHARSASWLMIVSLLSLMVFLLAVLNLTLLPVPFLLIGIFIRLIPYTQADIDIRWWMGGTAVSMLFGLWQRKYAPIFPFNGDGFLHQHNLVVIVLILISTLLGFIPYYMSLVANNEAQQANVLAQEAKHAVTELQHVLQQKNDFISAFTHDIRTPLASALGYLRFMHHTNDEQERSIYMERIQASTQLVNALLDSLLMLQKTAHTKLVLIRTATPIGDFVQATSDMIASLVGDDILLQVQIEANDIVDLDKVRMQSVLINLLGNAIKHTHQGSITVRVCRADSTHIRISIADTGEGIDPQVLPRIFERYEQGHIKDQASGYGLGLSICADLVSLHHGSIHAESVLGEGTIITVVLPMEGGSK